MQTGKALPQESAQPNMKYGSEILNLRNLLCTSVHWALSFAGKTNITVYTETIIENQISRKTKTNKNCSVGNTVSSVENS